MDIYEKRFQGVHQLLQDYGCLPMFTFEPGFIMHPHPVIAGVFFYMPDSEMHTDKVKAEWHENVDGKLDVCVQTKKGFSPKKQIRFYIEWSSKAQLYSMYVSLPTSSRSISLSSNRYKTQEELMTEIENWLVEAGCKKTKKDDIPETESNKIEQMTLF